MRSELVSANGCKIINDDGNVRVLIEHARCRLSARAQIKQCRQNNKRLLLRLSQYKERGFESTFHPINATLTLHQRSINVPGPRSTRRKPNLR